MLGWLVSPIIPVSMVLFRFGRREHSRLLANSQIMDAACTALPASAAGKIWRIVSSGCQFSKLPEQSECGHRWSRIPARNGAPGGSPRELVEHRRTGDVPSNGTLFRHFPGG